ncbi:MAG: hypothetical protein IPI44_09795 [Sulfuritalea sp.]|nr:hypothetical protein [Sulfuritalea sp.]
MIVNDYFSGPRHWHSCDCPVPRAEVGREVENGRSAGETEDFGADEGGIEAIHHVTVVTAQGQDATFQPRQIGDHQPEGRGCRSQTMGNPLVRGATCWTR